MKSYGAVHMCKVTMLGMCACVPGNRRTVQMQSGEIVYSCLEKVSLNFKRDIHFFFFFLQWVVLLEDKSKYATVSK